MRGFSALPLRVGPHLSPIRALLKYTHTDTHHMDLHTVWFISSHVSLHLYKCMQTAYLPIRLQLIRRRLSDLFVCCCVPYHSCREFMLKLGGNSHQLSLIPLCFYIYLRTQTARKHCPINSGTSGPTHTHTMMQVSVAALDLGKV